MNNQLAGDISRRIWSVRAGGAEKLELYRSGRDRR